MKPLDNEISRNADRGPEFEILEAARRIRVQKSLGLMDQAAVNGALAGALLVSGALLPDVAAIMKSLIDTTRANNGGK